MAGPLHSGRDQVQEALHRVPTLTLAGSPAMTNTDLGLVDVLARDRTAQILDGCH
ncbi:hypothetical protein [Streptomyces sp. NPDC060322]|uniref:hypothetical protein n=1 Tax=Streptomyces sp. NPDC060322 TaxID=3347097 RepID=UPI00364718E2